MALALSKLIRWTFLLLMAAGAAQADSPANEPGEAATEKQAVVDADRDPGTPSSGAENPAGLQDVRLELDPDRVRWRVMRLQAKKLLMTAATQAQLSFVDSASVADKLIPTDQGNPVMPGSTVVSLVSSTRFFGRESRLQVLMAPQDARAYEYIRDAGGKHTKHRIYRYTDTGVFVRTHRPASDSEREDAWESWTDISSYWDPIEPEAYGAAIVEPLGILYAVAAADLSPDGEPLELLSVSDHKVTRVTLSVHPATPREVDFDLAEPGGNVRCQGMAPAIRLEVDGQLVNPGASDAEEFEFLGLKDDINIYVEPESRLVLEVSGKAPIVGNVVIRLEQATLSAAGGCPAA
jgi:hypothetical protein